MRERELHLRRAGKRTYSYCIQAARQMLADTQMPVTEIGYACGLGSPSYFGKVFRELTGDTPLQYRRKWQNNDKK